MHDIYGYYHSIETFGTVDGPGIRYVLFLSGCQLKCSFCHNPDTWQQSTKTITAAQILSDIKRYQNYYTRSGGGLTVSGGEPLLQPDFVSRLFEECQKAGIHTLLDTSGSASQGALQKVLPYTDQVQFSIKALSPKLHTELTAMNNTAILANLHSVAAMGLPLIIRFIIIPGITDTEAELTKLSELVKALSGKIKIELLPYHILGKEKWAALGKTYPLMNIPPASAADIARASQILKSQGLSI